MFRWRGCFASILGFVWHPTRLDSAYRLCPAWRWGGFILSNWIDTKDRIRRTDREERIDRGDTHGAEYPAEWITNSRLAEVSHELDARG